MPTEAWWATDYHFDWLAGALKTFMTGKGEPERNSDDLIEATQEDVDFVIAAANHLILCEAKAYGAFDSDQYKRKIRRIKRLYGFYEQLKRERESSISVQFDFVFYSPTEPAELKSQSLPWGGFPVHIKLSIPYPRRAVRRCENNESGTPSAKGGFWCCYEIRDPANQS